MLSRLGVFALTPLPRHLRACTDRIQTDILSVVKTLYENLPASELARYLGVSQEVILKGQSRMASASPLLSLGDDAGRSMRDL